MEWNNAYCPNWCSYANNDEVIMTHGCSYAIAEFGQVAMHLNRPSYFCVTTATVVLKINTGSITFNEINSNGSLYYSINKASDLIIHCWNLNVIIILIQ